MKKNDENPKTNDKFDIWIIFYLSVLVCGQKYTKNAKSFAVGCSDGSL